MQLAVKGCRVSGICPKDVLLYKKYDRYQEIEKLQFILQNETFKYHTRDCLPRQKSTEIQIVKFKLI